jgi:hypothetical protein
MKERKTGDYVGGVIGNVIALVLVNTVLIWRPWTRGVVLESWADILWAANLSLVLQIVGNLVLAFYRPAGLEAFTRVVLAAAGLLSTIVFFIVFPLDFSALVGDWLNLTLRVLLIVGMGVTAVVLIVQLVRLITLPLTES